MLFVGRPRRFLCPFAASVVPTPVGVKFPRLSRPEQRRILIVKALGGRFVSLGPPRPCADRRRLHPWPGHPSTPNPRPNPAGRVHDLSKGQAEAMRALPWGDQPTPRPVSPLDSGPWCPARLRPFPCLPRPFALTLSWPLPRGLRPAPHAHAPSHGPLPPLPCPLPGPYASPSSRPQGETRRRDSYPP